MTLIFTANRSERSLRCDACGAWIVQNQMYHYDAEQRQNYHTRCTPPDGEREMVTAACGHTVPRSEVMFSSNGTACPDCYDLMEGA